MNGGLRGLFEHVTLGSAVASPLVAHIMEFAYAANGEAVTETTLYALYESPSQYACTFVQV